MWAVANAHPADHYPVLDQNSQHPHRPGGRFWISCGGETPGATKCPGIGYDAVYKIGVANRDARRGKSGGYRVIYYPQTDVDGLPVTLYSKSDQAAVTAANSPAADYLKTSTNVKYSSAPTALNRAAWSPAVLVNLYSRRPPSAVTP